MTPLVVGSIILGSLLLLTICIGIGLRVRGRRQSAYVDPKLIRHVPNNPRSEQLPAQSADITVVFTNVIDSVGLFEREGDLPAVEILNIYREFMVPIVRRHGGYLNKFLGDKMFIIFNTPVSPDKNHCASAVKMVLAMEEALSDLDAKLEKAGHKKIQMSIGVATGIAVVGDAGSAAASDYTALGDVVNIAARLEQACKKAGRNNLVSVETISQLGDTFQCDAVALEASAIMPRLAYEVTMKKEGVA